MVFPLLQLVMISYPCQSGNIVGIHHSLNCVLSVVWCPVDLSGMFWCWPEFNGGMKTISGCVL